MKALTRRALLLAGSLFAAACGHGGSQIPVGPSPFVAQLGGVWGGTSTLATVTGGECVGPTLVPGSVDSVSLTVLQSETDLSARLISATTGLGCNYVGRASLNSLVMDAASCDAAVLIAACPETPARDLKLAGSSITATISGGVLTGTVANTWNVFVSGEDQGVGRLVTTHQYTATRR